MHFSLTEFSDLSGLPERTLRSFHSDGLLVPESVDGRTGHPSYVLDQLAQVVFVVALREAGFGVDDVRRALDDRGHAGPVLRDHVEAMSRRRHREDEAVEEVRSLLTSWPEVRPSRFGAQIVLSALVPHGPAQTREGEVADERWYDWDRADRSFHDTVRRLRDVAAARHLDQAGPAWRTLAVETRQQKVDNLTVAGPHWLAKFPVAVAGIGLLEGALPEHVEVQSGPGRDEVGIRMPGRVTTAKYSTALNRLVSHPVEDAFPDLGPGGQRIVVHDDAFELFLARRPLDEEDG